MYIPVCTGRLLAHGHLKKNNIIDACPNPNHCTIDPAKPLYLIWAAEHVIPKVKMANGVPSSDIPTLQNPQYQHNEAFEEDMNEEQTNLLGKRNQDHNYKHHRSFSVEMHRPYRLDVWDRLSSKLKDRIFGSFDGPNVLPHQVIITSIYLSEQIQNGAHTLWFVDTTNGNRHETEIYCTETRKFRHAWVMRRTCTWKK